MATITRPGPLTDKQAALLAFVWEGLLEHGFQPSVREMGDYLGITSPNGTMAHLKALERKGWIELSEGMSRAIRFRFTPNGAPFLGLTPKQGDDHGPQETRTEA